MRAVVNQAKRAILQGLKLEKLHIEPRALALSPESARERYSHIFAPLDELLARLEPCPTGLLSLWLESARGHVILSHHNTGYQEGEYRLRNGLVEAAAVIRVADLTERTHRAVQAIADLLNHLMGSRCEPGAPWLSDGKGITPELAEIGTRLAAYSQLGYLVPDATLNDSREHFAIAFAGHLLDPAGINTADPLTYKLLRRSVMSESFWSPTARES